MKRFSNELNAAIEKYGESHVDLVLEDDYIEDYDGNTIMAFEIGTNDEEIEVDEIYNKLCRVLTEYEEKTINGEDLYDMLVEIQNAWETITSI